MNRNRMRKPVLALAILLGATVLLPNANAGGVEAAKESGRSDKYMFTDEVKPGMKGYGLTVFSETTIEKFDVEILSVLYGLRPGSDLILARVAGGPLEKAGVIAGMSGSPIYIDGRIIGALAYSWAFSKEAIAGITPIEEMLRIFDFGLEGETTTGAGRTSNDSVAWARGANLGVALPEMASESVVMRPIMTPIVFSGFSEEAIEMFRPRLEGWGMIPMVGGSFSDRMADADVSLEEGAAVGILFARGDMTVAGIGTVTINENGRILAFGHPFMLSGPVDLPMTTAYIHTILPSMIASSKVGSPLKSVGALTQDRSSGIAGIVGGAPAMAPLSLRIRSEWSDQPTIYNFEIARHRHLLPSIAGMALSSSLSQSASRGGEFTATVHYEIEIEGFPTIRNDNFISGREGLPTLASLGVYRDLRSLLNNQFAELSIKSISIDVEVREAVESARITSVRIRKDVLRPGEDIELGVTMKPYMRDPVDKRFVLEIPEHFPEGKAFVYISAAPQTAVFEGMRAPHRFRPSSVERLVELIDEDYPGNRLDIRVIVSDPGMVVNGQEMPALPSSVFSVMSKSIGREPIGITRASVMLEEQFFLDFAIGGAIVIPIKIDRKAH